MIKNAGIVIGAIVVLFLSVFISWRINQAKVETAAAPIRKGVGIETIFVTEYSKYIIDNRFDLCFYQTITSHGMHTIQLDCNKFKKE